MNAHMAVAVLALVALVALGLYAHAEVAWPICAIAGVHGGTQAATVIGGK